VVCCVNGKYLDASFAGREFDAAFLRSLPDGVCWCGENGEFHTFVYDGPGFAAPVPFSCAEVYNVHTDYGTYHYQKLLPVPAT
jgi:diphthamide synthase (EF-2-diphthine--ammonia ligase)